MNDNVWREDSGVLTNKTHLPVKQLTFGDTDIDQDGVDEVFRNRLVVRNYEIFNQYWPCGLIIYNTLYCPGDSYEIFI